MYEIVIYYFIDKHKPWPVIILMWDTYCAMECLMKVIVKVMSLNYDSLMIIAIVLWSLSCIITNNNVALWSLSCVVSIIILYFDHFHVWSTIIILYIDHCHQEFIIKKGEREYPTSLVWPKALREVMT